MNVLQVVSSSRTSGAEKHVLVLSGKLRARGHSVTAVCPSAGWLPDQLRAEGIPAVEIPMRGMRSWSTAVRLARLVRRQRVDVVHAHLSRATYLSVAAGWLARRPVVCSVHVRTHDAAYRYLFSGGRNRIITVSDFVREMLLRQGVPPTAVRTVHNGTDFGFGAPGVDTTHGSRPSQSELPVRAELSLPADAELVGLFGRVYEFKGHPLLIDAIPEVVRQCPRAYFLCVGPVEPQVQRELWERAAELGVAERVRFTGVRNDVERLLAETDVVTLPSRYEACSMAIIEAMAMGKPVVATRAGGNPELISDGETGILIERTVPAVAAGLIRLLSNSSLRAHIGAAARARAEAKFTASVMAANVETLYQEIV